MDEAKWYLRTLDETFGPETEAQLVAWARVGRIQPGQEISDDNVIWRKVEEVPFLDMRFSIDLGDGNPRGPYNKAAAEALIASGRLPPTARIVETREPFPEDRGETPPEGDAPEAEVPAGKVVERIVEVPVEKVVEKINQVLLENWGCPQEAISISVEEIAPEDWNGTVVEKEIEPNAGKMYILKGEKKF